MLSLAKQPTETGINFVDNAISSSVSGTDVLFEILSRLPLKSLLVFKSVSKQWLSIITDPEFIRKKHRTEGRLKIPGLFLKKDSSNYDNLEYHYICIDGNVTSTYVPFNKTLNFAGEDKRIVKSCNGLLLCSNCDSVPMTYLKYYVYNPLTKQYRILPPFNLPTYTQCSWTNMRCLKDIELAWDPLKSVHYKVICIWSKNGAGGSATKRIEIYSSETSSWRLCEKEYTFPYVYKSCVLWNGSLNWITNKGSLIYFDVVQETIGEVLSPGKKDGGWYTEDSCLNVYGGNLLYLLFNINISTCFEVMEMDTNYTGWILKYKVDMEGLKGSYPELGNICSYEVIFIDEVEEYLPKFIVLIYHSEVIISYDSEKNSYRELYYAHDRHPPEWNRYPKVYKHVESLACV